MRETSYLEIEYYFNIVKEPDAIVKNEDGSYRVKVELPREFRSFMNLWRPYSYFEVDADGVVRSTPPKFGHIFNNKVRFIDMEKALKEHNHEN